MDISYVESGRYVIYRHGPRFHQGNMVSLKHRSVLYGTQLSPIEPKPSSYVDPDDKWPTHKTPPYR